MSDIIARLQAVDACAVSDALDTLGLPGVALGLERLSTQKPVRGRVTTVRLVPAGRAAPSGRHLGTAAVEASGAGDVIVVDHGGRNDVSGWGGNLSLAAAQRGVEGVIVDGACRDLDESRDLDLPVFARGAVPITARGRVVEQDWNIPVTISGVEVHPGDYVIADGSGVVFIPADRGAEVLDAAEAVVERERQMAEQIRQGVPISQVMGAKYETMLEKA
ncbi:RraA family protein [Georgenia sp. AZ-5]|uniref:RraA family protein n=1 Tax=Georgenia sp. AZ-5 TaxID=3367526 RepID=UPI0037553408